MWCMYEKAIFNFKESRSKQKIQLKYLVMTIYEGNYRFTYLPNIKVTATLIQNCTSVKSPIKNKVKIFFNIRVCRKSDPLL